MANAKKKWVAFKCNSIIPAEMLGEEKDRKVQVGEAIRVPDFYADSVKQYGIADFCDAPKKKPTPKKTADLTPEERAAAEKAEKLAEAGKAVTDAQAAFDAVELGRDAGSEIAALKGAQDALAALQD